MIIDACGLMCSSYMSDSQSTLDPVAQVVSRATARPARRRRRDPLYVPSLRKPNSVERPRRARAEEAPGEHGLFFLDRDAVGQRRDPLVEVGLGHAVLHHGRALLVAHVQHRREVR